ncbi:ABC transporter substrate-binding protein [Kribbella sp. NPDC051620]|uniref:ABC transporter substrate-binding protein n=1 Tax=Kribbella sp. NPDC051620 TaxID=3364120 RepID=UPI0037B62A25
MAGLLAIAACSSGEGGKASGLTPISYAYLNNGIGFLPELMIKANPALCAPFGIEPEITLLSATTATPAVSAGKVQAGRVATGAALVNASKDPESLKLVASILGVPFYLFVPKSITSPEQLRGQKLTFPAPGGIAELLVRAYLDEQGVAVGKDVTATYSGSAGASVGLAASGAVQGLVWNQDLPAPAVRAGFHRLTQLGGSERLDAIGSNAIIVHTPFLKDNRPAVAGMLECMRKAISLAQAEPLKAAGILAAAQGISKEAAAAQIAASPPSNTSTVWQFSSLQPASAKLVISALEKAKVQQFGDFDPSRVIDNSLVETR